MHDTAGRNAAGFTQQNTANCLFIEIDRETSHVTFENQQFVKPGFGQSPHRRHAITDLNHPADLFELRFEGQGAETLAAALQPFVEVVSERWHEHRPPIARRRAHSAK